MYYSNVLPKRTFFPMMYGWDRCALPSPGATKLSWLPSTLLGAGPATAQDTPAGCRCAHPPPATGDTSCHTGDFSSLMVTSCSDNCVWDCAAYLKITLVVNVLFLRWLIGLREAGCTTAAVKVSQLPTHASPTPPPPRVPYLNSSNGQYGTCRDECETGHRVTELQSSLPPL